MNLHDKIKYVLDLQTSANRLSELTGVPQPRITNLRNGKVKIENLTVETAQKFADYFDTLAKVNTESSETAFYLKKLYSKRIADVMFIAFIRFIDDAEPDSGEGATERVEQWVAEHVKEYERIRLAQKDVYEVIDDRFSDILNKFADQLSEIAQDFKQNYKDHIDDEDDNVLDEFVEGLKEKADNLEDETYDTIERWPN